MVDERDCTSPRLARGMKECLDLSYINLAKTLILTRSNTTQCSKTRPSECRTAVTKQKSYTYQDTHRLWAVAPSDHDAEYSIRPKDPSAASSGSEVDWVEWNSFE